MSPSGDRWSADHYLTSWPRQLFPQHFADVLHPFFSSLLPLDADARLAAVAGRFKQLAAAVAGAEEASPGGSGSGGQGQQPVAVGVSSSRLEFFARCVSGSGWLQCSSRCNTRHYA